MQPNAVALFASHTFSLKYPPVTRMICYTFGFRVHGVALGIAIPVIPVFIRAVLIYMARRKEKKKRNHKNRLQHSV